MSGGAARRAAAEGTGASLGVTSGPEVAGVGGVAVDLGAGEGGRVCLAVEWGPEVPS